MNYRPYQKYWKVYHSQKKGGGGVALNQIHDIDYSFLFENYNLSLLTRLKIKFQIQR